MRVVAPSAIRRIRISSFGAFQGDRETAADWQESFLRAGNREQRRAIDLGNIHGAATTRRPFNGDVVAVHATHIKIAFQRIGLTVFPARWRTWPSGRSGPMASMPSSSLNSRRAAASESSPSFTSPFGID
jgi:hypothetical protein